MRKEISKDLLYTPNHQFIAKKERENVIIIILIDTFRSIWQNIFGMSFMYYGLFGTLVTVFVGIVFSWMTKSYEKNEYDERLLHPIVRKYLNKKMEDANDANAEYLKVKNNPSVYIISNDCENNEIYGKNVDNETPPPKYRRTDSS